MSTQHHHPDPIATLNAKWSFLPARQKSARHRIGPGVESAALDLLLEDAAAQLAEESRRHFDGKDRENFGEGEDEVGERWDGLS